MTESPRATPWDDRYGYSRSESFDVVEVGRETRDSVLIIDLTYASVGGSVPAHVVRPAGTDAAPLVIFAHWMMDGSPLRNRREFLAEAAVLARAGAIALLPDAPQVRPGFVPAQRPLDWMRQTAEASRQQVIDIRRGIDMLAGRGEVDTTRIAYVGHSFGAHTGAILAGTEKRIGSFVLMAGGFADEEYVFDDSLPEMREFRKAVGDSAIRSVYREIAWDDPGHFVGRSAPAAVFLQFGSRDAAIPRRLAQRYFDNFGAPKEMTFYDAGHALDGAARLDRLAWLAERLRLRPIDTVAANRVPALQ